MKASPWPLKSRSRPTPLLIIMHFDFRARQCRQQRAYAFIVEEDKATAA